MITSWDELDGYGLSGRLWRKLAEPNGRGFQPSGNQIIGFFDDFMSFQANTLDGPYLILEGANASVEQVNCTGLSATGGLGLVQLTTTGAGSGGANEEAVLQWGRGLCAPFKLADKDLAFEARLFISETTASKWSLGVGLGEVGMGATDCLFVDTTGALADKNFCGFVKLYAEETDVDCAYKADGQTYQDGATKTKLNAVHTLVDGTFVKVGFRYVACPKQLEFYVNGVLAIGTGGNATLTATELDAATFPDDVFMAPIIGLKDVAGDDSVYVQLDWWACAQAI
jgi:hypothetical protein